MDRVHFHQEQMLPELKEFEEKGIFSQSETRAILKQRTAFESALVRRVALKADFIKYVQYEITLEALRKKRVERINATETKTSLSDYCIVRRQFYIMERAVRKFKSDISLWIHYIDLAKSNNARALVGKLCSRALSLHPTSPPLFIIAASHELDTTLSPAGARALLQRGLRINPDSVALWTEYVRMELGYCEGLRRRWKVLGIESSNSEDADAREAILSGAIIRAVISSATQALPTLELLGSIQSLLQSYPTELRASLVEHLHSEFAVRDLGSGAAAEDIRCGATLLRATTELPSRCLQKGARLPRVPPLRPLVAAAFPSQPTPFLPSEQTPEFVDRIRKASETLCSVAKTDARVAELYARWVAAWIAVLTEDNLSLYLVLALTSLSNSLCKLKSPTSPSHALSTTLRIALFLNKTTSTDETQSLELAKKFSKVCPEDVGLWIARLGAESGASRPMDLDLATYSPANELPESVDKLWSESREKAKERTGEEDLLVDLWTWGIQHLPKESQTSKRTDLWTVILRQSLSHTSPTLHSSLLLRRAYDEPQPTSARATLIRKLVAQYRPSTLFYEQAMDQELQLTLSLKSNQIKDKGRDEPPSKKRKKNKSGRTSTTSVLNAEYACLETLYTAWRVIPDQSIPAVLKWASALRRLGEEEKADEVVLAAGGSKGKLKQEWEKIREEGPEGGALSDGNGVETTSSARSEQDIALQDVEFA